MTPAEEKCPVCGGDLHGMSMHTAEACVYELRRQLAERDKRIAELENFEPTSEKVNALPEGVRKYVAALETRCDPAGEVAELTLTRDQNMQLQAENERLWAIAANLRDYKNNLDNGYDVLAQVALDDAVAQAAKEKS